MNTKAQQGFTLIELIMVIVILGILAATALPKFADLGGDARKASLNAGVGAVRSAISIVHAKALIAGQSASTGTVKIEGNDVPLVYGYPSAAGISNAVNVTGNLSINTTTGLLKVGTATDADSDCKATYSPALSAGSPAVITPAAINITSSDCL